MSVWMEGSIPIIQAGFLMKLRQFPTVPHSLPQFTTVYTNTLPYLIGFFIGCYVI